MKLARPPLLTCDFSSMEIERVFYCLDGIYKDHTEVMFNKLATHAMT